MEVNCEMRMDGLSPISASRRKIVIGGSQQALILLVDFHLSLCNFIVIYGNRRQVYRNSCPISFRGIGDELGYVG